MVKTSNRVKLLSGSVLLGLLSACGGGRDGDTVSTPSAAKGQVTPVSSTAVGLYAASRFAEQVSFGPTPALVAEIRAKGFDKWIDEQFALPASQLDPKPFETYIDPTPDADWRKYWGLFPTLALKAPDQLRVRLTFALSQFITVSSRKGDLVGVIYWINMLQRQGFGRYDELLYQVSVSPYMSQFLDNNQNRPKSAECNFCAPNENFARELMQLFTIGVRKLNTDGSSVKNASGVITETYTQKDVEELARVMTGWQPDPDPPVRPNRNGMNWSKAMVPSTWAPERDSGQKVVLGKTFPAGQSHDKDLRDAISMLMAHQNIAPFVSLRLIQHLVKSNPSPAYITRVAGVFRTSSGDLKAVVKAILLDSEARAGDVPAGGRNDDGKLREPFLHMMTMWRGMGCTSVPEMPWGGTASAPNQTPFNAESVFSFYAPTDRAPGSNLLAPEQKLVNANELTWRLNLGNSLRWGPSGAVGRKYFELGGCNIDGLSKAYAASPRAYNDWLSERFFRGAMPPTLRSNIELLIKEPQWDVSNPDDGAVRLLDYALSSPYYGVIK